MLIKLIFSSVFILLFLFTSLQFVNAQVSQNENIFIKGNGLPSPNLGNNGDFFLDSMTGQYYQKSNGIWIQSTSTAAQGIIAEQGGETSQGGTLAQNSYQNPSSQLSQPLPLWMRNIAGMWANGQISDDEFVRAIQYLVNIGIIKV